MYLLSDLEFFFSPLRVSLVSFPLTYIFHFSRLTVPFIAPFAIITGQSVERTGHYVIQNYIGWALVMVGYGVMSLMKWNSSVAATQGFQIIGAAGLGFLYTAPNFAVLAPLAVEDNAHALALMSYLRTFGQYVSFSSFHSSAFNGFLTCEYDFLEPSVLQLELLSCKTVSKIVFPLNSSRNSPMVPRYPMPLSHSSRVSLNHYKTK